MPTLIRWREARAVLEEDPFTAVGDADPMPPGDVIISVKRFQAEGEQLLGEGRAVGVRVEAEESVEALAYDLPRLSLVALAFPKFKDGRAFSAARILRERLGFGGEVRAVGDVLLEQAKFMIRCGFDAFEPADGTGPAEWTAAGRRFRHVYQRASDGREPAFVERARAIVLYTGDHAEPARGRRRKTPEEAREGALAHGFGPAHRFPMALGGADAQGPI
ncbi:MAG TPA: DUF934 domain-containing protein [Caulobacteraceae bacterium]|nr:DUF934 domain-containing protein [Caulobacteraceae bacterium]